MSKHPFTLMEGRLGISNKRPYSPMEQEGVNDMSARLRFQGGHLQQERMIADKKRSLDRAVWNSYQAAEVRLLEDPEARPLRALINPNQLKLDYDDKVISIDYASNIKVGSVFEWINTKSFWIVYLQDLTELAYFKGDVRKCSYEIQMPNGKSTYAAIKGPSENRINSATKHGINIDSPNYSLVLMLPKTEENLKYFKRYAEFYLTSLEEDYDKVCWRVEGVDTISSPGIIEVGAVEYYANKDEDDIENGIVNGLIEEPKDPNPVEEFIIGETFIKPKKEYTYAAAAPGDWSIVSQQPVEYTINEDNTIVLKWKSSYSGQFELYCGDYKKIIIVESLF